MSCIRLWKELLDVEQFIFFDELAQISLRRLYDFFCMRVKAVLWITFPRSGMAKYGLPRDNSPMKYQRLDGNIWAIRLWRGEEVISSILKFAKEERVVSAHTYAIGAVSDAELGFYDLPKKEYFWKTFEGDHELVSATGNIALLDGEPFLHLHAVIADRDYRTFGGHLKRALAGATTEIVVRVGELPLHRAMDEDTGLNLWKVE